MLDQLLTEQSNPASRAIDSLPTEDVLRIINSEDAKVAEAVSRVIPEIARAVDTIVEAMSRGGRLFYIGAGTSGRLGVLDASECPPTFNVPAGLVQGIMAGGESALVRSSETTEDDPEAGARDVAGHRFGPGDVLAGIAASGRTPYVLGAIAHANGVGAATIGISCTPGSELSKIVKIPIELLVGPEVVTGSTRMKAGTATKMVLNMLSTATFIRRGYVFGNLMVNVQPSNSKLQDRARRIISRAAGVSDERASELLEASANRVAVAIVMAKSGLDAERSAQRLAAAGGRISQALHG
jgi:N-acetylmuramic acid 6-phosphate etherase